MQPISAGLRVQHAFDVQRVAQPRYGDPQRVHGARRRLAREQFLDQALLGDELIGVHEQHGQQCPLPVAAKAQGFTVTGDL